MEKDIGKIKKNDDMDIIIRIDDFGGKPGLTIREYVNKSESGYKGFTKSGTRIPSESFESFKNMINSINPSDLSTSQTPSQEKLPSKNYSKQDEENSGMDEDSLM